MVGSPLQPISHKFEWTHNVASRVKANILQEDHSEQSSISDKLFIDQIRSKKLDAIDGNMSVGAGSIMMRNQLMDSQSMQSVQSDKQNENKQRSQRNGKRRHESSNSFEDGQSGFKSGSHSPCENDELKNARGRSLGNTKQSD